jgi:hypothetical protein
MQMRWRNVLLVLVLTFSMTGLALCATLPTQQAETATDAVRRIYRISDLHATVQVRSSIVLQNFAIVVIRGTPMDDPGLGTRLLLEKFPFGWQPVALARSTCDLDGRGIAAVDKAKLAAGASLASSPRDDCDQRDSGPPRDVDAIRQQMYGPVVPYVIIDAGYAYAPEYGDSGGCGLFRKSGHDWELIAGCKGTLDPGVVERYHIPVSTQCAIGIAYTGCPKKRAAH